MVLEFMEEFCSFDLADGYMVETGMLWRLSLDFAFGLELGVEKGIGIEVVMEVATIRRHRIGGGLFTMRRHLQAE